MTEKIVTVESVEVKEKNNKEWVEIIDHEGKLHRIFPSMQRNDGEWVHLENEIEWLKEFATMV